MKTSNITKSALVLALGLCASGALAVTTTPVNEDFEGTAFSSGINGVFTNNLTWADTEGYSAVSGGKLVVDAADTPTSATITNTVANNINGAFGSRNAKFNTTATFVPATEDPVITGADLKFALYAKAANNATNLYVIANGGAQSTGIALTSVTDLDVEVAFTAADTFTVKVGNGTPSSAFTFANSGDISKLEFSGNGEIGALSFSYDLAPVNLAWPTTVSVASYTINGEAGEALTASSGSATINGNVGDAIVLTIQNADGVTKTFNGTVGTDATVGDSTFAYSWADYLGEAVNGAYEIDNLAELKLFQKGVAAGLATASTTFKLTDDVALDIAWPGIGVKNAKDMVSYGTIGKDIAQAAADEKESQFDAGAFKGVFDGQNHTVSGFKMQGGNLDYVGFFNATKGATIQNLKIQYESGVFAEDTTKTTSESGATFVGVAVATTLRNLTSLQKEAATGVSCAKGFGGIVGYFARGSSVEYCTNNVNITSLTSNKAGGIAMIAQNGSATATASATNTISHCQNNGTTTGSAEHGGLVGYVQTPLIIDSCESTVADQLLNHYSSTIIVRGENKANANSVSYIKHSGQTPNDFDGLHFATVSGDDATFVYDGDLALNGEYKVMSAGATATFNFTTTGTIAFNTALATPSYAITRATGLTVTPSTSGSVTTYTATVTKYTVTVSGDTSNLTATWTSNGVSVAEAPATLNHGDSYSVTFAAAEGYAIKAGETTTFSGTATAAVSITAPLVEALPSYAEGNTDAVAGHTLTGDEADYLNDLVSTKGASAVETALASIDEDDFVAAALLNQDITETNAGSYEFKVSSLKKKAGGKVEVKVTLTRSGSVLGKIKGTVVLKTCATPNGNYAEVASENIEANFGEGSAAATQEFTATFTGVTDKFFKAEIK